MFRVKRVVSSRMLTPPKYYRTKQQNSYSIYTAKTKEVQQ